MAFDGLHRPKRIIQPIAVEDGQQRKRFIICLGLSEVSEDLAPAISAWMASADFVEGGHEFHVYLQLVGAGSSARRVVSIVVVRSGVNQ
ncbi:hypothetical protein D9M71_497650 [compost metagenome]